MGLTKGAAINFLNNLSEEFNSLWSIWSELWHSDPPWKSLLSRVYSIIAILAFIVSSHYLQHLEKMQIEEPQTQSFSFIRLEARPGDVNCPVSLWIILWKLWSDSWSYHHRWLRPKTEGTWELFLHFKKWGSETLENLSKVLEEGRVWTRLRIRSLSFRIRTVCSGWHYEAFCPGAPFQAASGKSLSPFQATPENLLFFPLSPQILGVIITAVPGLLSAVSSLALP